MCATRHRIGIDVGGTFTDFVLVDRAASAFAFHKEPSTPSDPSAAVERGVRNLIERFGLDAAGIELLVHGTTIGLNAIIQRRGARMALVVSQGNRDILEIARLRLPSSYDFTEPREVPLVPRDRVFEIGARITAKGEVLARPSAEELARLAASLSLAEVQAVAVTLLNSYRDGTEEQAVAQALREALPGVAVTASSEVWPEVREYERSLVAALNAYIQPLMTAYFDLLAQRLRDRGVAAPIYITANNGGTVSLETARSRPIDTVLSGPASGVVASTQVALGSALRQLVTFDMGGTSADIALCREGAPELTSSTHVGDFPRRWPVVNVAAIGAGGGSVLWVDAQGLLKVGPHSAGAEPGPACYGRGGTAATITDCYVALGIIDPTRFLGGRMTLDAAAAVAALDTIAEALGYSGDDRALVAAEAALRVASVKMATETTKLLAQVGADPRRFTLVAYGGAGPTHASLLAEEAGLPTVLVPPAPGTFCALGAMLADVRRDYVRTARCLIAPPGILAAGEDGWAMVEATLHELAAEARAWIAKEGALVGAHDLVPAFDLRYPAQAYELRIEIPPAELATLDAAGLAARFHDRHDALYGFSSPTTPVQTTTIRLGVIGRVPPVAMPEVAAHQPEPRSRRPVHSRGRQADAAIYAREDIGAGAVVHGPAVVEQLDTTTLILGGWEARCDRLGSLLLVRSAGL